MRLYSPFPPILPTRQCLSPTAARSLSRLRERVGVRAPQAVSRRLPERSDLTRIAAQR